MYYASAQLLDLPHDKIRKNSCLSYDFLKKAFFLNITN